MVKKLAAVLALSLTMGISLVYAEGGSCGMTYSGGMTGSSAPTKKAKAPKKSPKAGKTVPAAAAAPKAETPANK